MQSRDLGIAERLLGGVSLSLTPYSHLGVCLSSLLYECQLQLQTQPQRLPVPSSRSRGAMGQSKFCEESAITGCGAGCGTVYVTG